MTSASGAKTADHASRTRSLDALFRPASIAVIGASSDPHRVGGRPISYLKRAGFKGPIYPINPSRPEIQGLPAYPSLAAVPGPVDEAIIAVSAQAVPQAVEDCIAKGVRAIVMFSSGFAEIGAAGRHAQEQVARRCAEAGIRLLGPNCLGFFNVADGAFSNFSSSLEHTWPRLGRIAIVTQSGAFGSYYFALAAERGLGFSHYIATGNEADVDVPDCLAWLADDPATDIIMLYFEGCKDGARLRHALDRAAFNRKPVVLMKVGTSAVGAAAAISHTGSLAGSDAVYDAIFRAANVHRARSIDELLDVTLACSAGALPAGNRLGIMTISGGVGILLADAAAEEGLELPPLDDDAQAAIRAIVPFASGVNPVDATAQVSNDSSLFTRILEVMLERAELDSVIAFLAHMGKVPRRIDAVKPKLIELRRRYADRLFVLGTVSTPEIRRELEAEGFLIFEDPNRAIRTIAAASRLRAGFDARRLPAPRPAPPRRSVLPAGEIDEAQAKRILAERGVPFAPERLATSETEAVAAADALGYPIALKVLSPDIAHKSEMGGVALDLGDAAAVAQGWRDMMQRVARAAPDAAITGGLVAPMVKGGVETVLGVQIDPVFGPIAMFGLGGVFVEVLRDVSLHPAPLDRAAARAMIARIKGLPLLTGARGRPKMDLDAIADALVTLAEFGIAHADELSSVEINPFIALPSGGVAVDALIVRRPGDTPR